MGSKDYQSRLYSILGHSICLLDEFDSILVLKRSSINTIFLVLNMTDNIHNILRIVYNTEDLDIYEGYASRNAILKIRE